jgi:hypothetical protein
MIQNEDKVVNPRMGQEVSLSLFLITNKRQIPRLAAFPFGFAIP